MSDIIHIDLETASRTDLLTEGVYNYASCPTTFVHCMAWAFGSGEVNLWIPGQDPFPEHLAKYIKAGVPLYAHNATFERLMFEFVICPDFDVPVPKLDQWRCTAYQARCNNLPTSLFNAARCLGIEQQKGLRGKELIKLLSVPQEDGEFYSTPELLEEFYEYCKQDVRTERQLHETMREPTDDEWLDYHTCERINDRGVKIDREMAEAAIAYAAEEEAELIGVISDTTEGEVTKARGENLKKWVVERLEPHHIKILTVHRKGEKKLSLDSHNRSRLLDCEDIAPDVRDVLEASDFAQKSSVGKFRAMATRADPEDDRVRGAFMANGASQSGRFSSKGAQVHNFPRKVMADPLEARADLVDNIMAEDIRDYFELPIMTILSRLLRPALIPADGAKFLVSDWSAIEGRFGPWLTDSDEGEAKLDLYRANDAGEGKEVYIYSAENIYGPGEYTKKSPERLVGKVAELSLQYGGGAGAFLGMGRNYGVIIPRSEAEVIKHKWRDANPWATQIWRGCEKAAMNALRNPEQIYKVGRLMYFAMENVLVGAKTLFCQLPCGRLLTYPDARIGPRETPWGEIVQGISALRAAWTPKATEKSWPRADLWGGLLFENATQGIAASLLRHVLKRAAHYELDVVLHVHDELVVESRDWQHLDKTTLGQIMNEPPSWAAGLPLKADVEVMERFGK